MIFNINKITENDLYGLINLYSQLVNEKSDLNKMKNIYKKIASNDNYYLLGAKDETDTLVGSIMGVVCYDLLRECRPFMVMENMIVNENSRGKGIGKKLIAKLESIAKEQGCIFIEFCSSSFRKEAHKFYESAGYNPDEVQGYRKFL